MSSFLEELAVQLFDAGAVQLGDIEAMVGRRTPIYFDLRVIISHPKIMMAVAQELQRLAEDINHELLCGVPYAALPPAAVMSVNTNKPMIMKRKETKLYATKKLLEGIYTENQQCLVVEDVVTSGGSLMETVDALRSEGLTVTDAVIVLDREQGGVKVLKANGVTVKSLFTLSGLVMTLNKAGKIDDETVDVIIEHIKECQFGIGVNGNCKNIKGNSEGIISNSESINGNCVGIHDKCEGLNRNCEGINGNCEGIKGNCEDINGHYKGKNSNSEFINGHYDGIDGNPEFINGICEGIKGNCESMNGHYEGINGNCGGVNVNCK